MIDTSQVTIVIPHLGGTAEAENALDECLRFLEETVRDMKKIIAVNGSRCIAHQDKWDLKIKQQGQCIATNAAVATTNTPWIFVTNDDMIYASGWWNRLVEGSNQSCISPRLVEPRPGAPTFI